MLVCHWDPLHSRNGRTLPLIEYDLKGIPAAESSRPISLEEVPYFFVNDLDVTDFDLELIVATSSTAESFILKYVE